MNQSIYAVSSAGRVCVDSTTNALRRQAYLNNQKRQLRLDAHVVKKKSRTEHPYRCSLHRPIGDPVYRISLGHIRDLIGLGLGRIDGEGGRHLDFNPYLDSKSKLSPDPKSELLLQGFAYLRAMRSYQPHELHGLIGN
jgi:hypothetical protein